MTDDAHGLISALEKESILLSGHFVLSGGDHSDKYINHDAIYANPFLVSLCARILAEKIFKNTKIETVIGPAMGGNTLAHETARWLSESKTSNINVAYSEKVGSDLTIVEAHKQYVAGRAVLFVDDALTTARTLHKLVNAARQIGARPAGVGVIWNRGELAYIDGMTINSIITQKLRSWSYSSCPQWLKDIPINTNVGHGKEFLESLK